MNEGILAAMAATRRILFVTKQRDTASQRYRAALWFDRLRRAGWEPVQSAIDDPGTGMISLIRKARAADVVVVCRRIFRGPVRWMLRLASRRLIFDFDDAIFMTPRGPSPGRSHRFAAMVRQCDQVWAGNDYLADHARRYSRDVRVLPTAIEPADYDVRPPRSADTFDLVWIGSHSTRRYLEAIAPALDAAALRVPNLRLKIIADFELTFDRLPTVAVPWSQATEAAELASSHVGLAPLDDNAWTRGKCGLKVLQYMAAELPVVSSPVGANQQIVIDGETGLFAADKPGWADAITRLANDEALRRRLAEAGRQRAIDHYSRDVVFESLIQGLDDVMRIDAHR